MILLALHAQKSSHMPKCVPTDRNQVCSLKFWHLFSVILHDFNSVCEYVFLHSCSLNTPSAFAARRDYCLRMALRRNGRLIFLDHRENGNGQQWARYFHFV